MTAIIFDQAPASVYRGMGSQGASDLASRLETLIFSTDQHDASIFGRKAQLRAELDDIAEECAADNWDGQGAIAPGNATLREADRFIEAFPSALPRPEIVAEPRGDIGFEWNFGVDRIFALSVTGDRQIIYAGILGKGREIHGTEVFSSSIPKVVLDNIRAISPK